MAKEKKRVQKKHTRRVLNAFCPFCKEKVAPSYKEADLASKFVNDRGRIVSRFRSGICARHQRLLTREIKRARFLALIPFSVKVS
ncbi:MAG: 30S ribosomal protein S18 [Candidatus Blackburnbacteria bacterium RIFCSPHIGHO2_02_FULL_39_13]|uniref:Small ribosomal subunit protein bS18 n=1 Tax=Candidatus Blackburnbacteria bacterium RIFCSPLOWO2_01_FULL_40_20 TaxID=1797519 RepID=A0A1G1VFD5_9BACT|nr:MAG: 30S ribosomal protein S18 [Candidatus Blackburnbacteria bacterium RIFCSPHIGHO2_01_FULL_40_17]OGY08074.1 MAG: 30S ribosomal protein S18 [Candidatus Blackburnbacteria bacterium RIFCSPHIGHO2_02_FULL_39_13]OGY14163.1 MAG: 30S ribosomal protein S18 [Candidatus Blackburnbacteria bacterium RIFCSPLOWO2_01_FULL_40_20]OGY15459.1 MAG: 30S ribosomal protein S18 [Candidatus Blackburnbacteria bacterium RIFCSPLOWO2_02_FULL_40_10]HBL52162.1 30S ribosomal protein S18 [Candidatus Blackburnbacteria bacter